MRADLGFGTPQASSIPIAVQNGLRTLEWIARRECLSVSGPSGTGKSHFVEALGHLAIDQGMRLSWFSLERLTSTINRSKVDASTSSVVKRICQADLIVVDDIGMLPAGQAEAEALYRLVDAAYEKRSLAVTSNIHPSGFDAIMPKALAIPTVDRLLHHAHVIITEGESQRLAAAMAGRGVVPFS
jgi:DNA replication protein DnaC